MTYTEPPERIPFRCRHCRAVIGQHNGKVLYIGGLSVAKKINFQCIACRRHDVWYPSESEKITQQVAG